MFSMEGYNSRTVFKYSVSQISIERIFLDKTIMTLTTAVGKKATELAEHLASGQQVVWVGNTLYVLAYCFPTMASTDTSICMSHNGVHGGRGHKPPPPTPTLDPGLLSCICFSVDTLHWTFQRSQTVSYQSQGKKFIVRLQFSFVTLHLLWMSAGTESAAKKKKYAYVWIINCVVVLLFLLAIAICIIWWKKKIQTNTSPTWFNYYIRMCLTILLVTLHKHIAYSIF